MTNPDAIRREERAEALKFARANVAQCSRELLHYRRSGELPPGKIREMAARLTTGVEDPLVLAEELATQAAMEIAAAVLDQRG